MKAIIFANRDGQELAPLNQYYIPAMLPVMGKPVIAYAFERMVNRKISDITIVIGSKGDDIKQYLESGSRWSTRIHYYRSSDNEAPEKVLRRLGKSAGENCLVLRGDVLHNADDSSNHWIDEVTLGNHNDLKHTDFLQQTLTCSNDAYSAIKDINDYYHTVMQLAENQAKRLLANKQPATVFGIRSNASLLVQQNGYLNVGDFSRISQSARSTGNVVVGRYCMIGQGVNLENCLIMDHTFIGDGLDVKNAIVLPDRIIRVDLNADFKVTDQFLVASTHMAERKEDARLPEKLVSLLVITCLLPLFVIRGMKKLTQRKQAEIARNHHNPFSSLIIQLSEVLMGRRRLFGRTNLFVSPSALGETDEYPWTAIYKSIPPGCFSLAKLTVPEGDNLIQLELLEIEIHQQSAERFSSKLLYAIKQSLNQAIKRQS